MCKDFFIEKRDLDGDTLLENTDTMENCVHFPEEQESDMPTCTCWIGDGTPDGEEVYRRFCEALRPFIADPSCGKIIIALL